MKASESDGRAMTSSATSEAFSSSRRSRSGCQLWLRIISRSSSPTEIVSTIATTSVARLSSAAMTALRLELLGDLQIRSANGSLVAVGAKKSQALLAYLGVKPSQRISREKIAAFLWSSTGPDQARQSLRQTLSTLRKELTELSPDAKILIEENDLLGLDDSLVECDVAAFEPLVAAGTEEALTKASHLYSGDFHDGFQISEERFDQCVIAELDRLHRMSLRAH